jgi:AsmA protein
MRLKRSSVPAGFPSASTSSAKDNPEEKGKHFLTTAVQTLQDLYKRLVQKLDWANLTSTTKRNLKIAGIVPLGLLVVLVALPFLINVNRFRPKIESEVTNALGRPVTLGNLSLSILTGTVGVDNINIADDPAFSKSPFITAKSVKVGVQLMPLIFSKQLNVTGIVLDEPQITLLKSASGTWNVSSLGGGNAKKSPEPARSGASQALSIAKLEIKDGKLTIGKADSSAKPQVYDNLNIQLQFFFHLAISIQLMLNLPAGGGANRAMRDLSIHRRLPRLPLRRA